jgi:hypothetical protein
MEAICSPKRRLTLNGLHGVIPQKILLFITSAVRTSNPTNCTVSTILNAMDGLDEVIPFSQCLV